MGVEKGIFMDSILSAKIIADADFFQAMSRSYRC